jgi:hypothetical protein
VARARVNPTLGTRFGRALCQQRCGQNTTRIPKPET